MNPERTPDDSSRTAKPEPPQPKSRQVVARVVVALALPLILSRAVFGQNGGVVTEPKTLSGDFRVHDPSLIRAGKTYYVFSTGEENDLFQGSIQIRASSDRTAWKFVGTLFSERPKWITDILGEIPNLWAPDVVYAGGKYRVYYAGSKFGVNESVIGLATNATLDPHNPHYHWVDGGLVLRSRAGVDDWNAIDPEYATDKNGTPWLAFGSFWDGIKMRRLDARTGKLSSTDKTLYALASRGGGPIEAPSIAYRNGYYYLFVSFDFCCRGLSSTYRIVAGRSRAITGPYVDRDGIPMMRGGGTSVLTGQRQVIGPGGQDVYADGSVYWLAHHFYDAAEGGAHKLDLRLIRWTADGWPTVIPR